MSKRTRARTVCDLVVQRWPLPLPLPSIDAVMSREMKDSKRGVTAEAEDELSDVCCMEWMTL